MPIGYQLIIRLVDDRPLAPTRALARRFVRCVARIAGDLPILAVGIAGGHAHIQVHCDRRTAGELARRLEIGLWRVLGHGVRWEPARIRPIHDQAHARRLFWYILGQVEHHGLHADPFHEATNIPDLLGARVVLHGTCSTVRTHLPEVDLAPLAERVGLSPPGDPLALQVSLLPEAAAAALALPHLRHRNEATRQALAAAVQLGEPHLRPGELATLLEAPPRTLRRLRRQELPPGLLAATRMQWAWRTPATPALAVPA